jgi:ribosomal-protein-alanine N-acetyltransferase
LHTGRLVLRPINISDAILFYEIMNDAEVMRYFPNSEPMSLERAKGFIENQSAQWKKNGFGHWALIHEYVLIGWCGLQHLPETNEDEVAYCIDKNYWGRGLATEAAQASVSYGFNTLKLKELIGITHVKNAASQNVLKKIGMRFDARANYWGMDSLRFKVSNK